MDEPYKETSIITQLHSFYRHVHPITITAFVPFLHYPNLAFLSVKGPNTQSNLTFLSVREPNSQPNQAFMSVSLRA